MRASKEPSEVRNIREPEKSHQTTTAAVIDIGSNSIRLLIVNVLADGTCKTLERAKQPVGLGHDTFINMKLSRPTIQAAIGVLANYKKLLDEYKTEHVIAVASSAVREATNADIFLERVARTTGLDVEMIDSSEEGQLMVEAVLNSIGNELAQYEGLKAVMEVGGGNAWIAMLNQNGVTAAESYDLGSIRIQEILHTSQEQPQRAAEMIRHHVANMVNIIRKTLPLEKISCFIALGGDMRIAADIDKNNARSKTLTPKQFNTVVNKFLPLTPMQIAKEYGVPFSDAETLVPALLTYQELVKASSAEAIIVSSVSLRDGLLWDFSRRFTGKDDNLLEKGIAQSAKALGEKYHYDSRHAEKTSQLALCLFDYLADEHGLAPHYRVLLEVAAILHDIGDFVSRRAHHRHSFYLILNSEIFGLRKEDMTTIAHIARYHRRSSPKLIHAEYAALSRDQRMLVNKLAAILRVADALDHNRQQHVRSINMTISGDELVINALTDADIETQTAAIQQKLLFFEETYGLRVRIEQTIRRRQSK